MGKSASFTGLKISCSVDACLNQNRVKCHFWCVSLIKRAKSPSESKSVFSQYSILSIFNLGSARLKIPAYENTKNINLVFKCWQWIHSMLLFRILGHICQWFHGVYGNDKPHYMLPILGFFRPSATNVLCPMITAGVPDDEWTCHDYRVPVIHQKKISAYRLNLFLMFLIILINNIIW